MRDVFDDKGFGVQAKGSIYESSSDMLPKWKYIRTEFRYERVRAILCQPFTKNMQFSSTEDE